MAYRETGKVREHKAAQRERLLATGEALVREGGFAALTVQALAARAGMGVGTVYRYFRAKDELATEVFRRATEREVAAVAAALAGQPDAVTSLRAAIGCFARRALRAPRLAWGLIAEPVDPAVDAERLRYRAAYAELFERVIDAGLRAGELPPQPTRLAAAALVGALAEALVGPLADHQADEPVIHELTLFCLRATGARLAEQENDHDQTDGFAPGRARGHA